MLIVCTQELYIEKYKKNQGNPNGQYILFMGWKTQHRQDIHSLQSDL